MAIVLGPIVGAVDQTSARIWLKTDTTTRFVTRCTDDEGNQHESNAVETKPDVAYTGIAELTGLLPDKEYHYSIDIDGEEFDSLNFRFRTAPEGIKDFWFAFGSCFRPCVHYTFVMHEFYRRLVEPSRHLTRPSFLLLLGDQIYADQSGIFPDNPKWQAATFEDYCRVYDETWRSDQWFLRSISQLPTLMIFDDHEVVNDWFKNRRSIPGVVDSNRTVSGHERLENALRAYRIYQASRNPSPIQSYEFAYQFEWGKVFFFVMDARSFRRVRPPWRRDIIGERQFSTLTSWLEEHRDDLKFVVTSVPISYIHIPTLLLTVGFLVLAMGLIFVSAVMAALSGLIFVSALLLPYFPFGSMDQWPGFNWGRKRLLRFIHDRKIGKLVFLAGDLHISNFIELDARDGNAPPIYQFTSSPIANETKLNFIHRFFMFRDWVPFYRQTKRSAFTESSLGTVVIRHRGPEGSVVEYGLITESGAWKRMSPPITFA